MINLIPTNARKGLVREYWVRVLSVWMILGGILAIVLTLLLVPSYVLVTLQRSAHSDIAAEALGRTEDYEASAEGIVAANQRVEVLLRKQIGSHEVTSIITNLKELSGDGVSVTEIRINRSEDETIEPITITGVASTRAELARFRNALEAEPGYGEVNLPISNLAKDVDIDFSVTVTLAGSPDSV